MEIEGLGKRMFLAHNALEAKAGRKIPYSELGRLIARQEGRLSPKGKLLPYSSGNVLRWEQEAKRPSLEAIGALAELAGLRKGWLAFNEGPMSDVGRTVEEVATPLPAAALLSPVKAKGSRKREPIAVEPSSRPAGKRSGGARGGKRS